MKRVFGSVRVRVSVAATLVFALAFTIAAIALVNTVRSSLEDDVRQEGQLALRAAVQRLQAGTPASSVLVGGPPVYGWVIDANGNVLSSNAAFPVPFAGDAPDEVRKLLTGRDDIAAIILEPTGSSWGRVPFDPALLAELRSLTAARGIVLIFDEVISGFRVSPGGAQAHYGITPDLTTMAKIGAGGLPGGFLAGIVPAKRFGTRIGRPVRSLGGRRGRTGPDFDLCNFDPGEVRFDAFLLALANDSALRPGMLHGLRRRAAFV